MAEFTADLNPKNTNQMTLGDMMKVGLYSAETAIAQRQAQMAEQKTKEMPIIQNGQKTQQISYLTVLLIWNKFQH